MARMYAVIHIHIHILIPAALISVNLFIFAKVFSIAYSKKNTIIPPATAKS